MFLIDDLTTIEYLKLTLPVYLVHSKVHERYKFFDYHKRQNKASAFRAKALQCYDRRIQWPRWRTIQYDNHGQKQLILTCYDNLKYNIGICLPCFVIFLVWSISLKSTVAVVIITRAVLKSFISFTDFIVLITIVDVSKLYQNSLSLAWEQSSIKKAEIQT